MTKSVCCHCNKRRTSRSSQNRLNRRPPPPPSVLQNLQHLQQVKVKQQRQFFNGGENMHNQILQNQRQLKLQLKLAQIKKDKKKLEHKLQKHNRTASLPIQPYLALAHAELESQIVCTKELCKQTVKNLNTLKLSNAYKNVQNHNDVRELHIQVSNLQKMLITRSEKLEKANQADMKKLDVEIYAANYKSDDDDLEIVENPPVLIDLVSETDFQHADPVASSSSSISISLDQQNVDSICATVVCDESDKDIKLPILPKNEPEGVPNELHINSNSKLYGGSI